MMGTHEGSNEGYQGFTPTLLFVDDEQNILSSLKRMFRPLGYRILTASGGAEALTVLAQEEVDLVISDMRMPEMDGAELLSKVAERWPDTVRILLTGFSDLASTIKAVNEGHIYKYISKPWEESDLKLTVKNALETKFLQAERVRLMELTKRQNEELKELNQNLEKKVEERTEELRRAHESLRKSYFSSIKTFSNLIELREGATSGHSKRVAELAQKVARNLGLGKEQSQQVFFAALLHDIGKIGLSDDLVKRPYKALTPEERRVLTKHPIIGEAVLMGFEPLHEAAKLIRSHHEYIDGSGYPQGLAGEDIPIGARILAAVNDYDALQNGAVSSHRMSEAEAREHMLRFRGRLYDPKVIDAFITRDDPVNTNEIRTASIKINDEELKEGMVLAKDLVTRHGILILSEGHILDKQMVERIHRFAKTSGEQLDIHVAMRRIR